MPQVGEPGRQIPTEGDPHQVLAPLTPPHPYTPVFLERNKVPLLAHKHTTTTTEFLRSSQQTGAIRSRPLARIV
jgi:hypothetical protein